MIGKKVRIEIVEILKTGKCPLGLKVGDSWEIKDAHLPQGMCSWAFNSLYPFLTTLRFGGSFPWESKGEVRVCCPDPHNPVVFKLTVSEEV